MKRLTERDEKGRAFIDRDSDDVIITNYAVRGFAIDRLAAYEDAEEQGLLVQFPKKVYTLDTTPLAKGVVEWEVMCGEYNARDKRLTRLDVVYKGFGGSTASVLSIYRGDKWYLTREEAEAAMKGDGNDV